MNVKAPVIAAILALLTVAVSACGSSPSKTGAASAPNSVAGSASSTTSSPATVSPPADPAATATATVSASNPNPDAPQNRPPVRTDIPGSAMLLLADLAPSWSGPWQQLGGPAVPGIQIVDPDNCDPVPRPQALDPGYPRNPAWVSMRSMTWAGSGISGVGESVITYNSAAAAGADFAKHRGWLADCAANFQFTDKPAKYSISNVQLNGVTGAYAIRVAMDPPDQPVSTPGSQGVVYMAVILRGNSLTVLSVTQTGPVVPKPQDPALIALQHNVKAAAGKLGAVYVPWH